MIGLSDGTGALLNPPADTVIGDRALIVVAEDDSVLATAPQSTSTVDTGAFADAHVEEPRPSHAVLIGWNERAPVVISGSTATRHPARR
ncbi:hypothetical protein G5V59_08830 [Nocardioides sp. W3-2-3]|uniref:hypothetical protein n=1 Tax=Nocardioides convexus TaxID=2712224 RepID=UPI00241852FE|nr:hypothetical protein [Nocardioides convexus]NHA00196.1 hypothetical protein [Nocardioides convexus]